MYLKFSLLAFYHKFPFYEGTFPFNLKGSEVNRRIIFSSLRQNLIIHNVRNSGCDDFSQKV